MRADWSDWDDAERRIARGLRGLADGVTPTPPDPREAREAAHGGRSWWPGLAAAAAVAGLVAGAVLLSQHEPWASVPAGTPTASATVDATSTPTPSASPTQSSAQASPAACLASQLSPSAGTDGAAAGTVYVVVTFRNTGAAPCWIGGTPALSATLASGSTVDLAFQSVLDSTTVQRDPVLGPGAVDPGGLAALHVSLVSDPTNCPDPTPAYRTLHVDLGGGQVVSMPFPTEMTSSGCLLGVSQVGPVAQQ